jgi:hypothetical protein
MTDLRDDGTVLASIGGPAAAREQIQQHRARIVPLLHSCREEHLAVADAFLAVRGLQRSRRLPIRTDPSLAGMRCAVGETQVRDIPGGT